MNLSRRGAMLILAGAPAAVALSVSAARASHLQPGTRVEPPSASSDQFTEPPGPLTDEELVLLSEAVLAARTHSVSALLCDPRFMALHPQPAFRGLIQGVARSPDLRIAADTEPGERMVARGRVVSRDGRGVEGAVMYAYQTSANGWYSDRAAHIRASNGDDRHARLFGYLRTGEDGTFEIETIRPGGYPQSSLPAHIHVLVEKPGFRVMVTELLFLDDPRLTSEALERATRNGFQIAEPRPGRLGRPTYTYAITVSAE